MTKRKLKVVSILCGAKLICPTIYETDSGSFVIQGFQIDKDTRSQLPIPDGEDAVEIPKELLIEALKKVKV
jgi:hypothetical protein